MKKLLRSNHRFRAVMKEYLFLIGCFFIVLTSAIIKLQKYTIDLSGISPWVADILLVVSVVLIISHVIDVAWMMILTIKPRKPRKSSLAKRIESAEKNVEVK